MTDNLTLQQKASITFSLTPEQTPNTCKVNVDKYDQNEIIQKLDNSCTSDPCLHYKRQILSYVNNLAFVSNALADKVKHISFHNRLNDSVCTITNNDNSTNYHMAIHLQ